MITQKCVLTVMIFVIGAGMYYQIVHSNSNDLQVHLSKDEVDALKGENIIIKKYKQKTPHGEIARIIGAIRIQESAEKVWRCILNWEKMSEYVDGLDYYKLISHINNNTSIIEGQIRVAFFKFRYTLLVQNQKDSYFQQWRLLSSDDTKVYNLQNSINLHSSGIKNIEGYQCCIPLDQSTTILYYAPIVEVSVPVPGFVESSLTQKSIKDYLYGIKRYLEKVK